jgi:hypothetical protein
MGLFDKLLPKIEEADRAVFQKYPDVKEAIDALEATKAELETKYRVADDYVKRWEAFDLKTNWDKDSNMPRAAKEVIDQQTARILELEAKQGSDMTWEDMEPIVTAKLGKEFDSRGVLTKDKFEKEVKPEFTKYADEKVNTLASGFDIVLNEFGPLFTKHAREFGEDLEPKKVWDHMKEKGIGKITDGYNSFVEAKRNEKVAAQHKSEIEAAEARGRENALKEKAMGKEGQMPGDTRGAQSDMGWFQRTKLATQKKQEVPQLPDAPLGSGAHAQNAYEHYLADQSAKNTVN